MNPKKVNIYTAHVPDMDKEEVGEYSAYDGLPKEVGDLVVLEVYPHFDDVMKRYDYEQVKKYPPEYLVLAKVTRFNEFGWGFYCKVLTEGEAK